MTVNLPSCNHLLHIYFINAGFLLGSKMIIHVSFTGIMRLVLVTNLHCIHVGSRTNAGERGVSFKTYNLKLKGLQCVLRSWNGVRTVGKR
jgi:hypothetical protein